MLSMCVMSWQPLVLDQDCMTLSARDIRMEKRTLFRYLQATALTNNIYDGNVGATTYTQDSGTLYTQGFTFINESLNVLIRVKNDIYIFIFISIIAAM